MAEEQVVYYSDGGEPSAGNGWDDADGDDGLQALMHAAADADARDNEEALKEKQISEYQSNSPEPTDELAYTDHVGGGLDSATGYYDKSYKAESRKHKHDDDQQKGASGERKHDDDHQKGKGRKRKHDDDANHRIDAASRTLARSRFNAEAECFTPKVAPASSSQSREGHSNVVAEHYNTLEEKGLDERLKSRIFYMRNFNNWIKSMLINEYLSKVKEGLKEWNSPIRVMDMCCGKGGDLLKWRKGNISHLICTDIASVSLEQCESRYREMLSRSSRERGAGRVYRAEFISADATRVHLRKRYEDPSIKLDLVSCQFAFHYSFESLPQAECMLRNAAECLQPGGYLIGTIPDANDILARQRRANSNIFGNDVFQIKFLCDTTRPPLFGAKYNFHLDGVVDCPEFLVHFPTFVLLARKHGLELVKVERFDEFYQRMKDDGVSLLQKMQSLETYPAFEGAALLGTSTDDYKHCDEFLKTNNGHDRNRIGTLSKSEWEAASLYLTFAFKKAKTTWDSKGRPQYEFK